MDRKRCSDERCVELKRAYETLDAHPSFQGAKAKLPMVAILDDHDYGHNDCNENNPYKDVAKEMFFDFYDIPPTDERRTRQNEGLYSSYEWGPVGKRLQLILLDVRYSRSKFKYDADLWGYVAYNHSINDMRMLSESQWSWLEEALRRPANVRLVVSSMQVLSRGVWGFEHWALIPNELDRLKRLLKKYCTDVSDADLSLPVLLSGGRHIGATYYDGQFDLYEVSASSWTHTVPDGWDPDGYKCEGDECIEEDPARFGGWVAVNNFGVVRANWSERTLEVSLVRAETSAGYATKTRWKDNTDAGEDLKKLTLNIP
jgi:alkaline phosphatase D